MWPKYMRLDMRDAFCCRLSIFRVFAKIKKTVSTSPGLPYILYACVRACACVYVDLGPTLCLHTYACKHACMQRMYCYASDMTSL